MLDIYKASAGSGKTYRLAYTYIRMLLQSRDPLAHRSILAITFTNKATDEMKRRIVGELALLAGREPGREGEHSDYEKDLIKDLGISREEIVERARKCLDALISDFGYFNVSTIDSFFQTILRAFAREAELNGNYELELDDLYVINQSVDSLLSDLDREQSPHTDPGNRRLKADLLTMMRQKMQQGKTMNILDNSEYSLHAEIVKFVQSVMDEDFAMHEAEIMEYLSDAERLTRFRNALEKECASTRESLKASAQLAMSYIEGAIEADCINKNAANGLRTCAEGELPKTVNKTMKGLADNPDAAFKKTKKESVAYKSPEALEAIAAVSRSLQENHGKIRFLQSVISNLHILSILGRIMKSIEEIRATNSTILLSDTNALLRRIIGDDPAPFIYERVGQRFRHFLIDEFQDTSRMQWQNLLPLIDESLSHEHDNLVIGDEKQCIYRFRNSDPTLLQFLHRDFGSRSRVIGDNIEGNTNWRSAADVVRFNNTFFRALATVCPVLAPVLSNVEQQISPKKRELEGYVCLEPLLNMDEGLSEIPEIFRGMTWAWPIACHIKEQIEAGYTPGDIAVLFRYKKEGAQFIDLLTAYGASEEGRNTPFAGLKFSGDDTLEIGASSAVALVISVMRRHGASDFSTSSRVVSERELADVFNRFEIEVSRGIDTADALEISLAERSSEPVTLDLPQRGTILTSLVEEIIQKFFSEDDRRIHNIFLTAFLDIVDEYCTYGIPDVRSFLTWWDTQGSHTKISAGRDPEALTVMTIHKAKGLEYPCVHVPMCKMRSGAHQEYHWTSTEKGFGFVDAADLPPYLPLVKSDVLLETEFREEYERMLDEATIDEANVLYVALTRPVRELHFYYDASTVGKDKKDEDARIPLVEYISGAIGKITEPEFVERLRTALPPGIVGDPFAVVEDVGNGVYHLGRPTSPVAETRKPRAVIDPVEVVYVPSPELNPHDDLWNNTVLDSDSEPGDVLENPDNPSARLRRIMRRVFDAASLESALRRYEATPAEAEILRTRLMEHPEWFAPASRVALGRAIAVGNRGQVYCERLAMDGRNTLHLVALYNPDKPLDRQLEDLELRRSLLGRAGYARVRPSLWNLESGKDVR